MCCCSLVISRPASDPFGFLSTDRRIPASSHFVAVVRKIGAVWPKGKVDHCVGPEIAADRPRLDPVAW